MRTKYKRIIMDGIFFLLDKIRDSNGTLTSDNFAIATYTNKKVNYAF